MGSNQGFPELNSRGENGKAGRYKVGKGRRKNIRCFKENVFSYFMRSTITPKSLLPRSVEKRPKRLRLEIEIK